MFKKLVLVILILLFIIQPCFSIDDNMASSNEILNSQDNNFYFDSNASNDKGDGSIDNPYKYLREGRILDNSIIHLSNGEYNFSQLNSYSNITIYGQDTLKTTINGDGGFLLVNNRLLLKNLSLNALKIFNQGDLVADNVVFSSSDCLSEGNDNAFGGAIYCVESYHNAYLTNCSFINNSAKYGGAIYMNGGILNINNCLFVNNTAGMYGGSIVWECNSYSKSNVNIKRSSFINSKSYNDAGGAIYIKTGNFYGENLNFTSCQSNFGSAITLLKSDSKLININAFNNTAVYDGGVIYQIHSNLTLINSNFTNNTARNGAALFITNSQILSIKNNTFKGNAVNLLGVIYLLSNNHTLFEGNSYNDNDLFNQSNISLTRYGGNYSIFVNNITSYEIPSYYNSLYQGYVTSVKNQETGGNCWAFSTIATLESVILKASKLNLDLSEQNMKNIAALYSYYGWLLDTNKGGYDNMGIGYLVSWLGPVLESEDEYDPKNVISPLLESFTHIQNVLYLKKSNHQDLNSIKQAILDYGAVCSNIYMDVSYDSKIDSYVQYYNGDYPCDHSVVLVGWDDNFYIPNAPGLGAWIVKNSWGSSWGNNGYFYVSYYDTSCPKLNEDGAAFTFILNDTVKFDKNYQYDIAKTDYFLNNTKTVWYKNIFKSTDNEYLTAVSTYFNKQTAWSLSIYVNNILKATKSGNSPASYTTINLDNFIQLNKDDVFEIIFKITVDGDAGVPISEIISLNNYFYNNNISFISYDGENWKDLYGLKWEYPDHTYSSQVACIKAFTIINPINTTINIKMLNRNKDNCLIEVKVLNQYGYAVNNGNITFTYDNKNHTVQLVNGAAYLMLNLTSSNFTVNFTATGYNSSSKSCEISKILHDTFIKLNISSNYNPINITALVLDEDSNPVNYGYVTFEIENVNYTVKVCEGYANLTNIYLSPQDIIINAYYNDLFYYNISSTFKFIEVKKRITKVALFVNNTDVNNPVNATVFVYDEYDALVNQGEVLFNFSGDIYRVSIQNYKANFVYTYPNTGLQYLSVYYFDEYMYASSRNSTIFDVSKIKVNLTLSTRIDLNNVIFDVSISNAMRGYEILAVIGDKSHVYKSVDNVVLIQLNDWDDGIYNYTFKLKSLVYEADDLKGQFNISYIKTTITAASETIFYNGKYSVVLKDKYGNIIPDSDIYLKINGKVYKNRTNSQGVGVFYITENIGYYPAAISFIGDDEFIKSTVTTFITLKSTIETQNSNTYTFNSKYSVIIKDSNGNLLIKKPVKILLNGVTYDLTTNNNGVVYLNIKLSSGSYIVQITNVETGEIKNNFIIIKKRITSNKDIKTYYGSGKYYKVRVCSDNGEFVKNLKVTFKVNGKTYYRYTDKNGYASFKIDLKPKTYKIKVNYKGFEVSNKIIVKTTLITKNINVKKGKVIKFKAKLLNSNGKILKNKKITFKLNGKSYKIKTNKKGTAILKITNKYNIGIYKIISKYGNLSITNRIKIKK